MNKEALRGLILALAVLGASVAQAAEDGKDSDDHLKKKHEALEGQAKAQRVQAEQMRELKQIQKQQQTQEAQEKQQQTQEAQEKQQQAQEAQERQQAQEAQDKQQAQEKQQVQEKQKGPQPGKSDDGSAAPGPLLRRGGQLPDALASDKSLWVKDWQQSRLPKPGEGQRWIQLNSGYVLTEIQSGIIEEILLGP